VDLSLGVRVCGPELKSAGVWAEPGCVGLLPGVQVCSVCTGVYRLLLLLLLAAVRVLAALVVPEHALLLLALACASHGGRRSLLGCGGQRGGQASAPHAHQWSVCWLRRLHLSLRRRHHSRRAQLLLLETSPAVSHSVS
jgi:hypothetical protein